MQKSETLFTKLYDTVLKDDVLVQVLRMLSQNHMKLVAHFISRGLGRAKYVYTFIYKWTAAVMHG